ncbi:hypothetical protein [Parasitella parasitica]|uniref:Transposase Tc1-like domain-containing protein n=1 Tax=Parasitella parasitica TaxID=35722 RepID=A0A0B7NBX5_9FUNG|nr:hypothetical protein [Parasitella parasitica]
MLKTTNITCCEKAYIPGLSKGGINQIAKEVNRLASGIYTILKKPDEEPSTKPAGKLGRPPKLTERSKRSVVNYTRKNRRATLGEITNASVDNISKATVRRALHEVDLNNRIARMKPYLNEASFELGRNIRQVCVWRNSTEEYELACLAPTFRGERKTVMVWGVISYGKKSKMVFLEKDKRSAPDFVDQVYEGPLLPFMEDLRALF